MDSQIPSNLSSNISSNLSSSVRESPKRKRGPAATTSSGNKSRTSPGRLFSNNNPRPNIRELNREDEEGNNEGNSEQINMDEVRKKEREKAKDPKERKPTPDTREEQQE